MSKRSPALPTPRPNTALSHHISRLPDQLPAERLASLRRAWRGWSSPLRHLVAAFGACEEPKTIEEAAAAGLVDHSDAHRLIDMSTNAMSLWQTRQAWTLALTACLRALSLPIPVVAEHHLDLAGGMTMDAACIADSRESVAISAQAGRVLTATAGRQAALMLSDALYAACAAEAVPVRLALSPVPTFVLGGRVYAY